MKKTLLTLVTFVAAMFTATAQTNLIENGDFETWTNDQPANWASTTSASNATLKKSTEAHTGAASVLVQGSKSNKRIAYKEITLKAGTYTLEFFAKAAVAGEYTTVRPGYAIVEGGAIISNGYKYGSYNDSISAEWVKISHEFTLDTIQTVNVLVMNAKKPGKDVLIDDLTLTTLNGGIDQSQPTPEPEPEVPSFFEETFANGQGNFTIENKVMPDTLKYVWNHEVRGANAYMKASAYANKVKNTTESWLVSPMINLNVNNPMLSFENARNFFKDTFDTACSVMIKAEGATDWNKLTVNNKAASDSWTFAEATADLKEYQGKKVQIAFVYTSTDAVAGTWEIKNVKLIENVTTGISGVTADKAQNVIFDMSGRRVAKAVKGLYIVNGKKVYVK